MLAGVILIALTPEGSEQPPTAEAEKTVSLPEPTSDHATPPPKPVDLQPSKPQSPAWQTLTVASGDNLSSLLQPLGVGANQIYQLIHSDERLNRLTKIRVGDDLKVKVDPESTLMAIRYHPSKAETLEATFSDGAWQTRLSQRQYQKQVRYAQATISDSLFLAGAAAGISDNLTMKLANLFAWDIDFVLDIRKNDRFRVLYEELYLDGEKVGEGDVLMAEFWNRDRHLTVFRYQNRAGDIKYLDPDGNSVRKAFIRTPVAFSRISSRFSRSRKHPILGRTRAHQGVDYAAPTGTPIKATGNGKVTFAGRKGGYGNAVIIKHGIKYSTLYGHMNGFASGIRSGVRVKQGQTIGYVGMSGLATGPHLHYEFRVNGTHRNPLTVSLPEAEGINNNERPTFLVEANRLKAQMTLFAQASALAKNHVL